MKRHPRAVDFRAIETLHRFVDAAYEESDDPGGLGGVLIDPVAGRREHVSVMLSGEEVSSWNVASSKKHFI